MEPILRITFVNPRTDIYPPIGLCYISAYLKMHLPGVVTILTEIPPATPLNDAAERILATCPDLVGITTYTVGFSEIVELCKLLKCRNPQILIVLGGPHITSLPESLPHYATMGVIGEGEATFLELCRLLITDTHLFSASIENVKGICVRADNGEFVITSPQGYIVPLDDIPPPDFSILNMKWYTAYRTYFSMKGNYRGFVLLSSRGCPFRCRFCQASAHWGRCRYHSPERVVSELERIRRDYPHVNAVNIIDDLFIGDRERLKEIVRMVKERNLHHGVVFNVNGHATLVNEEIIDLLKSINVIQVAYGFESGSDRVLSFLKKGSATVQQNRRAAELTNSAGIGVGGQFMIGSPGETEEDIQQTIDFIRETPMSHVHLSATTPMPGTELWEICSEKGIVTNDMDWRKLDFGNPDNPDLIYCNEDVLPQQRFKLLYADIKKVADIWNPVPSILANLSYWQLYDSGEFFRRVLQGLNRIRRQFLNKIHNRLG
jgi:anaerobic magnesium-protoporphyrin IX monomethyl ester cyclase